jgi:hypothetical protein
VDEKRVEKWLVRKMTVGMYVRRHSLQSIAQSYADKKARLAGVTDISTMTQGMKDAPEYYEELSDAERDIYDAYVALNVWVMISPCVAPYIKAEEGLELSPEIISNLSDAFYELNPAELGMDEKKSDVIPPEHTTNSETL